MGLMGGFSSCSYLDVAPPEKPMIKNAFDTDAKALGFLLSCYDGMNQVSGQKTILSDYTWAATDEQAPYFQWNTPALNMQQGRFTPASNTDWFPDWRAVMNSLGQIYLFEEESAKATASWITPETRNEWQTELTFLKAYYHFIMLQNYGPIPIIEQRFDQNIAGNQLPGRSHFDYCVDRIVGWFDEAEKGLKVKRDEVETRRATSMACKALKARLLLYAASPLYNGSFPYPTWRNEKYETPGYGKELVSHTYDPKKWERALTACKEALDYAINEGGYSLFGYDAATKSQDFRLVEELMKGDNLKLDMLHIDDNEDETFKKTVMLMRYLMTTNSTNGNLEVVWQPGPVNNTQLWTILPTRILKLTNGSWKGGWTGTAASLYSIEHFYTKDGKLPEKDPAFTPKSQWMQSAGLSNKNIIRLNHGREPRFYATFSFDGDEYSPVIVNGEPLVMNVRSSELQGYDPQMSFNQTGYYYKKWVQPNLRYSLPDGKSNARSYPMISIRIAELYLNLAECYAALGRDAEALEALNPIRVRAGVPALTQQLVGESGMSVTDWVRNERFVELYLEWHRYYDLRRWMIAPQRLGPTSIQGLNAMQNNPSFESFNKIMTLTSLDLKWLKRMYLKPIPQHDIYSNENLVQAPGY